MKKDYTTELSSMIQLEDDGTYTGIVAMTGLSEDLAEDTADIMYTAVTKFFKDNGLHSIPDLKLVKR